MAGNNLTIKSLALVSITALAITFMAHPACSADQSGDADKGTVVAAATAPRADAEAPAVAKKTLKAQVKEALPKVKEALQKVNPLRLMRDREFKKAAALFPDFCKDWERKLHDRQVNNLSHITWQIKDGWETGTYVGYSPVQKCECHQSSEGYSIGKVTYDEFQYYVVGKTPDEAKHAEPKVRDTTSTTELFRWDKEKWFY